jgi:lipopolysaccharide/colanic/teichoic acid biosynthesis glycosyltransferase
MLVNGSFPPKEFFIRTDRAHQAADSRPSLRGRTFYGSLKVILDFTLSAILLVLSAPLIVLAAVAVKLTSTGPVFYTQVRLGRGGRPFTIFKIRTMVQDCEKQSGAQWSTPGDPRVTRVGRFLRRTHIDELPQLWNVMRGDMSLVGPRPERPEFVPRLENQIPGYRERLRVRPGVAGLAQVQLPPDTDLDSVQRKLAYDLYYVRRMSLWLDLRILFCTGCGFLGLPASWARRFFFLPHGGPVERAYQRQVAQAPLAPTPAPELQPA